MHEHFFSSWPSIRCILSVQNTIRSLSCSLSLQNWRSPLLGLGIAGITGVVFSGILVSQLKWSNANQGDFLRHHSALSLRPRFSRVLVCVSVNFQMRVVILLAAFIWTQNPRGFNRAPRSRRRQLIGRLLCGSRQLLSRRQLSYRSRQLLFRRKLLLFPGTVDSWFGCRNLVFPICPFAKGS